MFLSQEDNAETIKKLIHSEKTHGICRICLSLDKSDMRPLIFERFTILTGINVDGAYLPQNTCAECYLDLENAIRFKEKCDYSESLLQKLRNEIEVECGYVDTSDSSPLDSNAKVKEKQFCCKICKKTYKRKQTYVAHKRNAHQENGKSAVYKISGHGQGRVFHCISCDYSSEKARRVEIHYRTHTGERPHSCNICLSSYSQLSTLLRHKKTAHTDDTPYSCSLCSKKFKILSSLKRHQVTHEADYGHKCDVCDKLFKWKHVRDDHVKRHSKSKNLECEICGRLFSLKGDLSNHLLIHKRDVAFSCEMCDFTTHVKTYLKRHIWTHTGEAKCACEICGKIFSKRGNLLAHKLVHSSERLFDCKFCDKKYKQKHVLKKHMAKHSQC